MQTAVKGYGYILVATPGTWADIYVDGELAGQTTQADPIRLRPGSHRLKLGNPYFETVERIIEVKSDAMQKERVEMKKKDAK